MNKSILIAGIAVLIIHVTNTKASANDFLGHDMCSHIGIQIERTYEAALDSSVQANRYKDKRDIDIRTRNILTKLTTMETLVSLYNDLGCEMDRLRHKLETSFTEYRTLYSKIKNRKKRPSEIMWPDKDKR